MATLLNVAVTSSSSGVSTGYQPRNSFESPRNLAVQVNFKIAAGSSASGLGMQVFLQTQIGSFGFFDIASFKTTAASTGGTISFVANLSAMTPVTPVAPVLNSLTTGTIQDGLLGGQFQVSYVTLGTYTAGSNIEVDTAGLPLRAYPGQ